MHSKQASDESDRRDKILVVIAKWLERLDWTLNRIRMALEVLTEVTAEKKPKGRRVRHPK